MLTLLFIAAGQMLPAELETVNLRITKIEERGSTTYVVTSEQIDERKPKRVKKHAQRKNAIEGEHMKQIAMLVARDPQSVFVLPEAR